ncbi:hypothetical protein B0A50_04295 [Salinomyces thailandicus]|uniref:Uncharacterized protein n=1 Tax=Salinomyces thailandicus TaxID=706561 RepID=A0A4V5N4D9_9PEZI|nr:hypothetical protein B0A50_04295 [Salinomyces thailandica]
MWQSQWAPKPEVPAAAEQQQPPPPPQADIDPTPPALSPAITNELRPTSSLSASAPTFAPATPGAPPPDVSTSDEFAQTGAAQEDLFDDVIAVDESMRVRSDDDLFADDFTPVTQPIVEQPAPLPAETRTRGGVEGSRGRARGGGRARGRGASAQVKRDSIDTPQPASSAPQDEANALPPQPAQTFDGVPTGPQKDSVPSVRGDRRATGGVRKPKLSEDELASKMAQIKLKNAELSAAHERAEADAASFAHREAQAKHHAAQKAKVERKDRQQMMGERERNRLRKLKAMEGREWDVEKQEEDFRRGGKFDKVGGFAGDQRGYTDGREYLYQEPRGGGGGGRGGSRGGRGGRPAEGGMAPPPRMEEFPALAGSARPTEGARPGLEREASANAGKSWADQVESAS